MTYLKFQRIQPENEYNGPQRQGHTVNYIPKLNSLLMLGGCKKNDVYTFQVSKKQWQFQKSEGKKPDSRKYHASFYEQSINCLFIHGGQTLKKTSSNQCYVLHLDTWIWKKVYIQTNMPSRQNHMIVPNDSRLTKQLYLFGGVSLPYGKFLNDLWKISNVQDLQINSNLHQIQGSEWSLIETKGKKPPGMFGYCSKIINNKFFVFGGKQPDIQINFNIYSLCLKSLKWECLSVQNKYCPSLTNFSVFQSYTQKNKFYIFGGISENYANKTIFSLNISTLQIREQNMIQKFQKIMNSSICQITDQPLCLGFVDWDEQKQDIQINIIIEDHQNLQTSKRQNYFATDQYQNQNSSNQQISIEDYLKAIKHQQILSQQLISKNRCLQQIYKQMQKYITKLYKSYLTSGQSNQTIQREKQKSIRRCEDLKQNYVQIEQQYSFIVSNLKHYRGELGQIHEDFQKCMDTQIDQQIE